MTHDFAKQRSPAKPAARRKPPSATRQGPAHTSHWSWFCSGLLSGLLLAVIGYLAVLDSSPVDTETASTGAEAMANVDDGAPSDGQFDFYDYLPEAEVMVDVIPVEITRNEPADDDQSYLLQAGSFQDRQDAENRRAGITLLNLDAKVVPGTVSGRTWHRVQVGPFKGRRAAEKARDLLASENIDTIVLRTR